MKKVVCTEWGPPEKLEIQEVELPDVAQWDPSPEDEAELRERLLRAGDARTGDN